jgi:hypothetical protein
LAIPVFTFAEAIRAALWLSLLVRVEVIVLSASRMRCPLTTLAMGTPRIDPTTSTSSFRRGSV